jgi:glycerophosphoryl diester phosphodiesterase
MGTFTVMTKFVTQECNNCGVSFAVTEQFQNKRLEVRGPNNPFYCPNGHKMWYIGKSDADVQRERAEKLEQQLASAQKRIDFNIEAKQQAERQAAAARGQVTKIKNRVGRGVCPCCNRQFENLHRHMTSKHPNFHQASELN